MKSSQTHAKGHAARANLGTGKYPQHDGSGAGADGPSHHKPSSPLSRKPRDNWKQTEQQPENSGRGTWKRQVDWRAVH